MPRVAYTLGDVAGIGPEVVARALADPGLATRVEPVVYGHPAILERVLRLVGDGREVVRLADPRAPIAESAIACVAAGPDEAAQVAPGANDARAGRAAYESLIAAADACLAGRVDAIVTAPLSKKALQLAGLGYPGHTEILAERCGIREYAMMLYLPPGDVVRGPLGLGVAHVTLHTSIRSVPGLLSMPAVRQKISLLDRFLRDVSGQAPRIGVCALNPHAGEEGLFGDEESRIIRPAVLNAAANGVEHVSGPYPADTLLKRAVDGEFDGVVAMYHDQGHIALKLIAFGRAVNVTLGLPIVRTSPSHGTAFDIAWQGKADPAGFIAAVETAAALVEGRGKRGERRE